MKNRFTQKIAFFFLSFFLAVNLFAQQNTDVLIQGFNWDSHSNTLGWYNVVKDKAADLGASGIDMIWLPPPSDAAAPQGYLPRELYTLNTPYGTQAELIDAIDDLNANGVKAIADIVINHRVGTTNWADFTNPTWGCWAVTSNDEWGQNGGNPCGGFDTGDNYHAARDVDHTNPTVQSDLITWMNWLKNTIGFEGWRYDYVRGYSGYYNSIYDNATSTYFSVGELWDNLDINNVNPHRQQIVDWIDATQGTSHAFDFTTKGILNQAVNGELWRLSINGAPPGVIGWYPSRAVTFIDNHDTGSTQNYWPFPGAKVMQGYAYILTHPGVPSIFWDHFYDWGLHDDIAEIIAIRKDNGLHSTSTVNILLANWDVYAAEIDGKVAVKIGPGSWSPSGSGWILAASGQDYAIWEKNTSPPPTNNFTVYFNKPTGWANPIYIHHWGAQPAGSHPNSNWPGVQMTNECDDWYSFTFNNTNSSNLLFHDNQGNQTADLNRGSDGWYENGAWSDTDLINCGGGCTESLVIHFKKPTGWTNAHIYFWNPSPAGASTTWPGELMTPEGDGWYTYEIPCANCADIIFSDNGANQTADLSTCGESWYNGSWHSSNPDTGGGDLTVHFKPNSYTNPEIYFWNVTPTGQSTSWPGVQMTAEGGGWYAYTFAGANCANFIFSNNGASQSPDLASCQEVWYENGNWNPLAPVEQGGTGYLQRTDIQLAPNPATERTNLRLYQAVDGEATLQLYDLKGQQVKVIYTGLLATGPHQFEIQTGDLQAGVYILRYVQEAQQFHQRLVITN